VSSGTDYRAARDAIWRSSLPPVARFVALRLVEHLPRVCPSVASLAEHTGYGRDAVMAALHCLERGGCLEVIRQRGRRSEYRFTGCWPKRQDRSTRATGRREPPVGETDDTSRRDRPPPVDEADTKQTKKADNQADKYMSGSTVAPLGNPSLGREIANELQAEPDSAAERGPSAGGARAAAREVFEHWQTKLGHPKAKLDGKRERAIRVALKLYSKDDLKRAVDGCARDDFHMGRDPKTNGKRFDDIELICRDSKHVESFIAMADATSRSFASALSRRDQPNQPNCGLTGLEIFQRQKVTVTA
jgi:hypothetical protein